MSRSVKIIFNTREKRRVRVAGFADLSSYALSALNIGEDSTRKLVLHYLDEESDWIRVTNEAEWEEAWQFRTRRLNENVIYVRVAATAAPKKASTGCQHRRAAAARGCCPRRRCAPQQQQQQRCRATFVPLQDFENVLTALLGDLIGAPTAPAPAPAQKKEAEKPQPTASVASAKIPAAEQKEQEVVAEEDEQNVEIEAASAPVTVEETVEEAVAPVEEAPQQSSDEWVDVPHAVIIDESKAAPVEEPTSPVATSPVTEEEEEAAPSPPTTATTSEYSHLNELLEQMGFSDRALNAHMLRHQKGNVQATVDALLKLHQFRE